MVEVRSEKIVGGSVLIGFAAAAVLTIGGLLSSWGSRRDVTDYSFQYRGKPATVMHKDIRWGVDIPYI